VIGPFEPKYTTFSGVAQALLPLTSTPAYFPNAADVIVIGCRHIKPIYVDAALVIVLGQQPKIYLRQPGAPLVCPLPEPVCDDNHVCR
jgi:hypothetical protein